jgi:histidinol-phosphatase (PHP family)
MASPQPITWIRKDYHVHESHSSDAPGATVERYCRMAERRGIDEIAFTTHLILTGPDVEHGVSPEKIPEYLNEIEAARVDTTVELRSGLEIDYFPEVEKRIEAVLDEHSLDFVLGSLHYIRGIDIGSRRNSPRFFAGRPLEESLDVYFDGFREAIESGLFDAMAHPDYFRKYLHLTRPEPATWEEYGTTIYRAIDSLRSHGVGISVNSSGWRHGIGDVYPIRGLLEAANKAGVEKVTIGSDCHSIEDLGFNTLRAVRRLEEAGYSHVCVFEKRRNRKVSLTDVIDVKPRINLIP